MCKWCLFIDLIPRTPQHASKNDAQVFATDAILSVLMVAPRSVNSWDIVIGKENGKIYLDKREGGAFGD